MGQDASTARERSDSIQPVTPAAASGPPRYSYASASVSPEDLSRARASTANKAKPDAAASPAVAAGAAEAEERVLVVNSVDRKRALEPEIEKLRRIPEFQPILGSGTYSGLSRALLGEINPVPMAACFQRVQDHMQMCAKRASADQFKLAEEAKASNARVTASLNIANKASLKLDQVYKALKPADDIVKEVQSSLQALASLHGKLTELNARLPPEDRLPSPPMPRARPHSDVALPVAGVPGSN